MAKILVTGAAGYIGSVATYLLLEKGHEVVALDNFSTGFKEALEALKAKFPQAKLSVYEADLKDDLSQILEKEVGIEAVLHYAASCVVDESIKNPFKYFNNNVQGTLNLVETLVKYKIDKIVFSSTCAVYGEAKEVPISEEHPTNPNNPYGESKLMAENVIRWYGQLKGLNYVILRYFNVSGTTPDGLLGYSKNPSTHLTENAVKGGLGIQPFKMTYQKVDTPDGSPIRDYVNVVDLNEAHLLAIDYLSKGGKSEIINLGTGTGNSVSEIVNKVKEIMGVEFEVQESDERRKGEASKLVASIEKASKLLGWQPKRSIEDSVNSLIKWYKQKPKGW